MTHGKVHVKPSICTGIMMPLYEIIMPIQTDIIVFAAVLSICRDSPATIIKGIKHKAPIKMVPCPFVCQVFNK